MNGFVRTFYAAAATFAARMAKRRLASAGKWTSRAERWKALAAGAPPPPPEPRPDRAGTTGER